MKRSLHILSRLAGSPAAIAAAAVLSLAFAPFGLNVQDEGFYFTFYQNIFSHADAVAANFPYYLTGPAGGAGLRLLPGGGLLWLRALGIACTAAAALIACRVLAPVIGRRTAYAASALLLLTPVYNTFTFGNTHATILLYAIMMLWLDRGLRHRRAACLLAAGIAAGVNCFVRVPNVLGLAAAAIVLLSDGPRGARRNIRPTLFFLLGTAIGIALVVALQAALGHLTIYLEAIRQLFAGNDAPEMPHSSSALLMAQASHYGVIALRLLPIAAVILGLRLTQRHHTNYAPWIVAAATLAVAAMTRLPAIVWTIALIGSLVALRGGDKPLRHLIVMGLFMMLIIPCGSDNYFNCGTLTALLAFPIAARALYRRFPKPTAVALALLAIACVATRAGNAYHILAPRAATTVNSTQLRGIHCEAFKARALNALLNDTRCIINPGDTLLVFANAPLINALTETVPALGNSWPGLMNNDAFIDALSTLPDDTPILVHNFIDSDWQYRAYEHLGEGDPERLNTSNHKLIALDNHLASHRYTRSPRRATKYFTLYRKPTTDNTPPSP